MHPAISCLILNSGSQQWRWTPVSHELCDDSELWITQLPQVLDGRTEEPGTARVSATRSPALRCLGLGAIRIPEFYGLSALVQSMLAQDVKLAPPRNASNLR